MYGENEHSFTMKNGPSPDEEPRDTQEAILWATYRAFQTYGYAELSISKIADEVGISKSALYNHYSGKDELLVSFLEFVTERYQHEMWSEDDADPLANLRFFQEVLLSDQFLNDENTEVPVDTDLLETMIELKVQALHNEIFEDHFTEREQQKHELLANIIENGIKEGNFQEVDPDATAQFIQTVMQGALFRRATTEEAVSPEAICQELDEYLQRRLFT